MAGRLWHDEPHLIVKRLEDSFRNKVNHILLGLQTPNDIVWWLKGSINFHSARFGSPPLCGGGIYWIRQSGSQLARSLFAGIRDSWQRAGWPTHGWEINVIQVWAGVLQDQILKDLLLKGMKPNGVPSHSKASRTVQLACWCKWQSWLRQLVMLVWTQNITIPMTGPAKFKNWSLAFQHIVHVGFCMNTRMQLNQAEVMAVMAGQLAWQAASLAGSWQGKKLGRLWQLFLQEYSWCLDTRNDKITLSVQNQQDFGQPVRNFIFPPVASQLENAKAK